MERLLWVCLAGGVGAGSRYLIGVWAGQRLGTAFPYGTLIVNLAGCYLIALCMQAALSVESFPPGLRLALTTGFLGGLTTYSSYNYEMTRLFQEGAHTAALADFAATTGGGFVAGLLGLATARLLFGS